MRTCISLLFLSLIALSPGYSQQIILENKSTHILCISVAVYVEGQNLDVPTDGVPSSSENGQWVSQGWYYIRPNSKITIGDCIEMKEKWFSQYVGYYLESDSISTAISAKYEGYDCPGVKTLRGGNGYKISGQKTMAVGSNSDFNIKRADKQTSSKYRYYPFYIFKGSQNFKVVFE